MTLQAQGRFANRRSSVEGGFTLVEMLVATALGLWLVTGIALTVQQLWQTARVASDQAELAERGDFAIRVVVGAVQQAWPVQHASRVTTPCGKPDVATARGIRVVLPGRFPCLPQHDLMPGTPLLVIEGLEACQKSNCGTQRLPGWRLEQPGCDPLFLDVAPQIKHHSRPIRDSDCAGPTELSIWNRRVFYLRDFSWQQGDGLGALMMASWRSGDEKGGFGRGEMLAPRVAHWNLTEIKGATGSSSDPEWFEQSLFEDTNWVVRPGLDFSMRLLRESTDASRNSSLVLAVRDRQSVVHQVEDVGRILSLTLQGRGVSQYLTHPLAHVPLGGTDASR